MSVEAPVWMDLYYLQRLHDPDWHPEKYVPLGGERVMLILRVSTCETSYTKEVAARILDFIASHKGQMTVLVVVRPTSLLRFLRSKVSFQDGVSDFDFVGQIAETIDRREDIDGVELAQEWSHSCIFPDGRIKRLPREQAYPEDVLSFLRLAPAAITALWLSFPTRKIAAETFEILGTATASLPNLEGLVLSDDSTNDLEAHRALARGLGKTNIKNLGLFRFRIAPGVDVFKGYDCEELRFAPQFFTPKEATWLTEQLKLNSIITLSLHLHCLKHLDMLPQGLSVLSNYLQQESSLKTFQFVHGYKAIRGVARPLIQKVNPRVESVKLTFMRFEFPANDDLRELLCSKSWSRLTHLALLNWCSDGGCSRSWYLRHRERAKPLVELMEANHSLETLNLGHQLSPGDAFNLRLCLRALCVRNIIAKGKAVPEEYEIKTNRDFLSNLLYELSQSYGCPLSVITRQWWEWPLLERKDLGLHATRVWYSVLSKWPYLITGSMRKKSSALDDSGDNLSAIKRLGDRVAAKSSL